MKITRKKTSPSLRPFYCLFLSHNSRVFVCDNGNVPRRRERIENIIHMCTIEMKLTFNNAENFAWIFTVKMIRFVNEPSCNFFLFALKITVNVPCTVVLCKVYSNCPIIRCWITKKGNVLFNIISKAAQNKSKALYMNKKWTSIAFSTN